MQNATCRSPVCGRTTSSPHAFASRKSGTPRQAGRSRVRVDADAQPCVLAAGAGVVLDAGAVTGTGATEAEGAGMAGRVHREGVHWLLPAMMSQLQLKVPLPPLAEL